MWVQVGTDYYFVVKIRNEGGRVFYTVFLNPGCPTWEMEVESDGELSSIEIPTIDRIHKVKWKNSLQEKEIV